MMRLRPSRQSGSRRQPSAAIGGTRASTATRTSVSSGPAKGVSASAAARWASATSAMKLSHPSIGWPSLRRFSRSAVRAKRLVGSGRISGSGAFTPADRRAGPDALRRRLSLSHARRPGLIDRSRNGERHSRRRAAWLLSESTRKFNGVGKNPAERPGKPDDSEELVSFRQNELLYITYTYNTRVMDGRRGCRLPPRRSTPAACDWVVSWDRLSAPKPGASRIFILADAGRGSRSSRAGGTTCGDGATPSRASRSRESSRGPSRAPRSQRRRG